MEEYDEGWAAPRDTRTASWVAPSTYGAIWPDFAGSDSAWYGD